MSLSIDSRNDYILIGMIKLMEILQETKNEGEDLNTVDFKYIIEHRIRDMINPSLLEEWNYNTDVDLI